MSQLNVTHIGRWLGLLLPTRLDRKVDTIIIDMITITDVRVMTCQNRQRPAQTGNDQLYERMEEGTGELAIK